MRQIHPQKNVSHSNGRTGFTIFLPLLLLCLAAPGSAVAQSAPTVTPPEGADYFPAMTQELSRMQLSPQCTESAAACTFRHRSGAESPEIEVQVRYSKDTDTVYAYIDKLLTFESDETPSADILLRLLALNAEMVTSKLEWQTAARAVRLSTVLSCDAAFDRRAFRSQIKGLLEVAKSLRKDPILHPPAKSADTKQAPSDAAPAAK